MRGRKIETALERIRERALRRIELNRIAGMDTRHSRATNLLAIRELTEGHPHYTFGLKDIKKLSEVEALDAIAAITKCSNDPNVTTGGGYISPNSTLKGLEETANVIYPLAKKGGKFFLATGHPGSLLLYYIELGKLIERYGGRLVQAERGAFVPPNFDLDYVEGIAVISDRCSLFHSHDPKPMEMVIASGEHIDLVVSDHGFAAGAVNAKIPVIGIIDTNDPALAVAKHMGANITLIPMDDNRPMYNYLPVVEIIKDFIRIQAEKSMGTRQEGSNGASFDTQQSNEPDPRPEIEARISAAWDLIAQRSGGIEMFGETLEDILGPYTSQFFERHFDLEKEEHVINDPFLTIAIYKIYHDALVRFIREQVKLRRVDFTEEEIEYYFGKSRL